MRQKILRLAAIALLLATQSSIADWKKETWDIFKSTVTETAAEVISAFVNPSLAAKNAQSLDMEVTTHYETLLEEYDIPGNRPDDFEQVQSTLLQLKEATKSLTQRVVTLEQKVLKLEEQMSLVQTTIGPINQSLPEQPKASILNSIKPSFICANAKEPIEHSICQSFALRYIDGRMGTLYWELRKGSTEEISKTIREDQVKWLKWRDEKCMYSDENCLIGLYEERIEQLKSLW